METNVKAIELRDLWRRYKDNGDPATRERLVLAYLPLVKYVAGRMSSGLPAHVEEADLISYGLIGLISAIERFDTTREIRFETFAITRIKGSIIDELRSLDWVPRSVRAKAREIERANAKLEHKLHRAPTDQEMATELEVSVDDFQESLVKISNSSVVALDELWTVSDASGDQVSLLDTIQDENAADPAQETDLTDMKDRLADAIARLPEREKLVLALFYGEHLTLREIGEMLGLSESRAAQLHTKAALRLKSRLDAARERALALPTFQRSAMSNAAMAFEVELERLLGDVEPEASMVRRAAQIAAAEHSWQLGLGVLLGEADARQLLDVSPSEFESLLKAGDLIALTDRHGRKRFPAFQFPDARPTPSLARAHDRLVTEGHISPWSAASWAQTEHSELNLRSPAKWVAETGDETRLEAVARHDASRLSE
jgi:RNA polymerase sigma factor for flagellar operon FliA